MEELRNRDIILSARNVKRTYGKGSGAVHALTGIDLEVRCGKLVALRGRSGSGKTTLLNLLAALDMPTEGEIGFLGQSISSLPEQRRNEIRRKDMGLIFQSFALVPHMSAYENVEFGTRIAGMPSSQRKMLSEQALEFVGMTKRMNHRPNELSGGEQQRTAIARAVAHRPKLILADEPTAELDSRMALQVMKLFTDLVRHEGMTVILTSHDPAIMEIVDQIYILEDGKLVETT